MTHDLSVKSEADLEIKKTKTNGLETDSRILLDQIQPIHKNMILENLGGLSVDEWERVRQKISWNFART